MKKLFLYKVYHHNKTLFFLFSAFAGFSIICNLSGHEITPFYVWAMYSERETPHPDYKIFRITENNKLVDYTTGHFPATRLFLQSPLTLYASSKNGNDPNKIFLEEKLKKKFSIIEPFADRVFNSPAEIQKFPDWYKRYLEQLTGEKIQTLKVDILSLSYQNDNSFKVNSVHNLINEK